MNWVYDCLAVGTLDDARSREMLQCENIDFVIDVRHHFTFKQLITGDEINPFVSVEGLAEGVALLLENGYTVLLYCMGGVDRAPFVAALVLYFMYLEGLPFMQCYEDIKEMNPQTFIHDEWARQLGLIV